VWRQADKYHVPRICFINKLDRMGANFVQSYQSILERLTPNAIPAMLPMGLEADFEGVIDLVRMKAVRFSGGHGEKIEVSDIPDNMKAEAEEARANLLEKVAEVDDDLTEKYLEGGEITEEELRAGIRKGTLAYTLVPVFCGTALKNKGVQMLLDAVVDYLPSPLDVPPVVGIDPKTEEEITRKADDEESFSALAFKLQTDPYVGQLTYFRVYSGVLQAGSYVYNATKGEKERVGRILRMHANDREEVKEIYAGEIGAMVGLKNTTTGDTLSDPDHPIILEKINFSAPVISLRVEPKTKADQEKMGIALKRLSEEDPTFQVHTDTETMETIISGMGELHLEILVDRMKREFNVATNVGQPRVAYKETVKKGAEAEGKYIRQSGGRGQYGHVKLRIEPLERGAGVVFENSIKGGSIPREYIPAVEKGIREAADKGVIAGYPLIDVKVILYDGSFHEVDSSEGAFKIAGSMAFQEVVKQANPVLLEPIMKVEVTTPDKFMGDVTGDLNAKRGRIDEMADRPNVKVITANVPLSEMFGYTTNLRSMTEGRASSSMEFSHFEEVPTHIAEQIREGKK